MKDNNMEFLILEAAEQLFLEQGFAKTTTGQIAERAGCNQALVHYYYRTKDKLFDRIFEEKAKIIVTNFLTVKGRGTTFQERIEEKIRAHFDFVKENSKLIPFLYVELSTNPDRIKPLIEKIKNLPNIVTKELEEDLEAEIKKGNVSPISFVDLFGTIICLNVTAFLIQPIVESVLGVDSKQFTLIIESRKEENVKTVLARLKP